MKTTVKRFILLFSLSFSLSFSQNFQGIATYKTHTDVDIKMDSTKVNNEMQKQILEMMKKQFQKTYKLTFNQTESIYKEEQQLDKPNIGSGNGSIMIQGLSGGDDLFYKNIKSNSYANKKDTFGKIFLVKDSIENLNWTLEKDTKYIGEYQCFKASYTKMVEKVSFSSLDDDKENKAPEMEERVITAWYTPQIPVSNGPGKYQGLPGLILEIHDGKTTTVCSKIVMNPNDKIEIEAPTKGKEVSSEEYKAIMEKKSKEMMERYRPKKGDRNSETIEIRIGG